MQPVGFKSVVNDKRLVRWCDQLVSTLETTAVHELVPFDNCDTLAGFIAIAGGGLDHVAVATHEVVTVSECHLFGKGLIDCASLAKVTTGRRAITWERSCIRLRREGDDGATTDARWCRVDKPNVSG